MMPTWSPFAIGASFAVGFLAGMFAMGVIVVIVRRRAPRIPKHFLQRYRLNG